MQQDFPAQDVPASSAAHIPGRFSALIWSFLDAELNKSAVFYAERYYSLDHSNHDARHLYALSLFRCGQTHSAMNLVNNAPDQRCSGCAELRAKCCTKLGMHTKAREALLECANDHIYLTSGALRGCQTALSSRISTDVLARLAGANTREARIFPEEAALHCRAGFEAMKGNLPENAAASFRQALVLNPMLWEAFEGLCAAGM